MANLDGRIHRVSKANHITVLKIKTFKKNIRVTALIKYIPHMTKLPAPTAKMIRIGMIAAPMTKKALSTLVLAESLSRGSIKHKEVILVLK